MYIYLLGLSSIDNTTIKGRKEKTDRFCTVASVFIFVDDFNKA